MYNMEITLRVEIIILIAIVLFILWGHVICSCSKVSLVEGVSSVISFLTPNQHQYQLETTFPTMNEGFTGANTNYGQSAPFSLTKNKPINTTSWFTPNLSYAAGATPGKGAEKILNRPAQPIPLPEGEMLMFATTEFKPECCPNAYSTSTGCACMDMNSYNYLINRGGNNVPYSEY